MSSHGKAYVKKPEKDHYVGLGPSVAQHKLEAQALEAEAARFRARMEQRLPELQFRYMFTEIDLFERDKTVVWDLWMKFPFRISKAEAEQFKVQVNRLFQDRFCQGSRGKGNR